MTSRIARVVRQHPLVTFFALAYGLSWWGWALYAMDRFPAPIASFGPFLAALVVLAITHGRTGVGTLLRRMVRWRVGLGWYAVALLLPPTVSGAAAGLNVLLGAEPRAALSLAGLPDLFVTFLLVIFVPGVGGTWEEPGWRGYAQPRLQARRSALAASLILGVLWAGWHLPLFATGQASWTEIGSMIAAAVVLAWVFNGTGGSVLIAMLFHATNNSFSGELFGSMFTGADAITQAWLISGLWSVVAVAVTLLAGAARLSHQTRVPTIDEVDPGLEPASTSRGAGRPQPAVAPAAPV